jgi:Leucine-rich repeat (LRR) protein
LTALGLSNNAALIGNVPSEIGLLTSLTDLDLSNNAALTGSIPSEIGLLTSLIGFASLQ